MKFCYVDESGCGEEPVLVMAAVAVDTHRMHVTKEEWNGFLKALSEVAGREIKEFHARDCYRGNGIWHKMTVRERANVISKVLEWIGERRHKIQFTAVDKAAFEAQRSACVELQCVPSVWCCAALHLVLSIQKAHQSKKQKEAQTLFVFDREVREDQNLYKLLDEPPAWSDKFYGRGKKAPRLGCVVDVPYFADSHRVFLIQVADLIAYILRTHSEIVMGVRKPKYSGEDVKLTEWVQRIGKLSYERRTRWPARGRNTAEKVFQKIAPAALTSVGP